MTRVLLSGEYPFLAEQLEKRGIEVVLTTADPRLPPPVRFHPDMQVCHLRESLFVSRRNELKDRLMRLGFKVEETEKAPGSVYPRDVLCNAFMLDGFLVCNPESIDSVIADSAAREGLRVLAVKQGYAACAVAVVNENSVITADAGIGNALRAAGFDVLQIRPGGIRLPGYDTGFIGGCCGLLEPGLLAVAGSLKSHPDGEEMRDFLKRKNVEALELREDVLLDIGGIVCLD